MRLGEPFFMLASVHHNDGLTMPRNSRPDDDEILTFEEWIALNKLSARTGASSTAMTARW
jgi:hypothetical protein